LKGWRAEVTRSSHDSLQRDSYRELSLFSQGTKGFHRWHWSDLSSLMLCKYLNRGPTSVLSCSHHYGWMGLIGSAQKRQGKPIAASALIVVTTSNIDVEMERRLA
jgi:hypothetical protein